MNCLACPSHCCGKAAIGAPILLPDETASFAATQKHVVDDVVRLARGSNGLCLFLDAAQKCTIYDRRPLECRLYPWIIQFVDGKAILKLDARCWDRASATPIEIPESVKALSMEFIKRFTKQSD